MTESMNKISCGGGQETSLEKIVRIQSASFRLSLASQAVDDGIYPALQMLWTHWESSRAPERSGSAKDHTQLLGVPAGLPASIPRPL